MLLPWVFVERRTPLERLLDCKGLIEASVRPEWLGSYRRSTLMRPIHSRKAANLPLRNLEQKRQERILLYLQSILTRIGLYLHKLTA